MFNTGTEEPWHLDEEYLGAFLTASSVPWRKPLRLAEVNQMAPTPEVNQREGRA